MFVSIATSLSQKETFEMGKTSRSPARGIEDFFRPDHLISEEIRLFCQTLRKFVDNEVLPHAEELDDYWDWTERKDGEAS
jgi:hypothetical protein